MKKSLFIAVAVGVMASLGSSQAAGLIGSQTFSGNTSGNKAFQSIQGTPLYQALMGLKQTSGGEGGTQVNLNLLNCIPEFLTIKGGNGFVVIPSSEFPKDGIIPVSMTHLLNGGGQVPTISHFQGFGECPSVPEPSSALASLAVLGFGGLLVRRYRKR